MHSVSRGLVLLVLSALITACNGEPAETPAGDQAGGGTSAAPTAPPADIGEVIATVGGVKIGSKEFELAAQRVTPANGESLSAAEKREVLEKLVTEKILYLEAREKGIDQDPKVQKVMINTLLRQDVYANVSNSDFSNEELLAYFEAHKEEFVVPEKVHVKRIFLKTGDDRSELEAQRLAADLRAQIVANPDRFKDLATESSEDPYRRRGGDLGFLSREGKPGVPPEVIEKAFTLEVNQVSEPFAAGGGLNLVLVASKRERVERTFDQMKGSVLRKVKNERYKQLYDDYVAQVKGDHDVKIDEEKLSKIAIEPARRLSLGPGSSLPIRGADEEEDEGHEE